MDESTDNDGTITKKQAIVTVVYLIFFANGEQWTPVNCYLYKFTVTKKKKKTIVYLVVVDVKELKMKKDKKTNNKVRIKKIKKIFKWNGKQKELLMLSIL